MRFRLAAVALLAFAAPLAGHAQKKLTVHLKTADGKDAGTARFRQIKDGYLEITLDLKNLSPGDHGVHIHEKPLCEAPDFKSAGGHFDPDAKQHGYMNPAGHHNGDLPNNVTIGPDGTGHAVFQKTDLSLGTGKKDDIIDNDAKGTAIMVHAGADDEKTDPSGGSGARVACGVIVGASIAK